MHTCAHWVVTASASARRDPRAARVQLCRQMSALMLSMWRRHRHICENFNPHRNATECSGTRFYHWGALAGFIDMLEKGVY